MAFVGDAVLDTMVRTMLVAQEKYPMKSLHRRTVRHVNATAQAKAYHVLIQEVDDEEKDILRRGRNAKVSRVPRSATLEEYTKATAVEALFGYLYLCQRTQRIGELFQILWQSQQG